MFGLFSFTLLLVVYQRTAGFVVFIGLNGFCDVSVDCMGLWCFSGLDGFVVFQWTGWFCCVSEDCMGLWCFSGLDGFVVF